MPGRRIKFEKMLTWSLVWGLVLLCGVLSMAYGFYQNDQAVLQVGLAVVMPGVFNGILFLMIQPDEARITGDRLR